MSLVITDRSPGAAQLEQFGVLVTLDLTFMRADGKKARRIPVNFFVDTGSTTSAIRPAIAKRLKPPLVKEKLIATGIDGSVQVDSFYGLIVIGDKMVGGRFTIQTLPNGENDYDGIIGRDVLRRLVLTYDGPAGKYTITMP